MTRSIPLERVLCYSSEVSAANGILRFVTTMVTHGVQVVEAFKWELLSAEFLIQNRLDDSHVHAVSEFADTALHHLE
jgi:hypothetical protein